MYKFTKFMTSILSKLHSLRLYFFKVKHFEFELQIANIEANNIKIILVDLSWNQLL